jgi:hypothetical protein
LYRRRRIRKRKGEGVTIEELVEDSPCRRLKKALGPFKGPRLEKQQREEINPLSRDGDCWKGPIHIGKVFGLAPNNSYTWVGLG